jgi:serine/threonine protein kinase
MATVFLGALQGDLGFRQLVAIKRPHPHLLDDGAFREAWMREAQLAAGIHHANVVDVRDVEVVGDAIQLVMDYIEGAPLGELVAVCARQSARLPAGVAVRIVLDACAGLHAAHEACDDAGHALGMVHRDVSPQNILVGVDGVARVTDFGIAKCAQTSDRATTEGILKGKAGYMAPEYVRGEAVDRRADVFALGVVAWEALAGKRLFRAESDGETLGRVLTVQAPAVSESEPQLAPLDAVVARALSRDREERFATAEDFGHALEVAASAHALVASHADVGRFVRSTVGDRLDQRRRAMRDARGAPGGPPVDPQEESTTVPEPRHARSRSSSRLRFALAAGGTFVLAGVGIVALARSRAQPAAVPSAPYVTATAETASPSTSVTNDSAPSATAVATLSSSIAPPPRQRPRTRPSGHSPPPNPYPSAP